MPIRNVFQLNDTESPTLITASEMGKKGHGGNFNLVGYDKIFPFFKHVLLAKIIHVLVIILKFSRNKKMNSDKPEQTILKIFF